MPQVANKFDFQPRKDNDRQKKGRKAVLSPQISIMSKQQRHSPPKSTLVKMYPKKYSFANFHTNAF